MNFPHSPVAGRAAGKERPIKALLFGKARRDLAAARIINPEGVTADQLRPGDWQQMSPWQQRVTVVREAGEIKVIPPSGFPSAARTYGPEFRFIRREKTQPTEER